MQLGSQEWSGSGYLLGIQFLASCMWGSTLPRGHIPSSGSSTFCFCLLFGLQPAIPGSVFRDHFCWGLGPLLNARNITLADHMQGKHHPLHYCSGPSFLHFRLNANTWENVKSTQKTISLLNLYPLCMMFRGSTGLKLDWPKTNPFWIGIGVRHSWGNGSKGVLLSAAAKLSIRVMHSVDLVISSFKN